MRRKYLRADLARDLGLSRSSVSSLAKRGMPTHSVEAAVAWRRDNLDPSWTKPTRLPGLPSPASSAAAAAAAGVAAGAPGEPPTYRDARARREVAEAEIAELALRERRGELVRRDEVEREARRVAVRLVQLLDQVPDRVAPELPLDDAARRRVRARLAEELHAVRAELVREALIEP